MLKHMMKRFFGIVWANPAKIFKIFSITGWRNFLNLRNEKIVKTDPLTIALQEAEQDRKRADFNSDAWTHEDGFSVRQYDSYETYVAHQVDKLDNLNGQAFVKPEKAVRMFQRRFELVSDLLVPSSVLCLGARCGEEVQAFINLGHFALGVDLNPGDGSRYVLTGDFHDLQFADSSIDCVYVNCLDHALDIKKIMIEVNRLLKPGGLFLADLVYGFDEGYVAGNHDTMHWPTAQLFANKIASLVNFKLERFQDLTDVGSPLWTSAVMRKS